MSRNRLKSTNKIQIKRLWKLFAVCGILTVFAFVYVLMQIKMVKLAEENKKMELILDEAKTKNAGLQLQIQRLKSPVALQRRMDHFNINMAPISDLKIVDAQVPLRPSNSDVRLLASQRETSR